MKKQATWMKNSFLGKCGLLILSAALLQGLGFVFRIAVNRLAGTEALALYQLIYSGYSILMALALAGVTLAVSRSAAQQQALANKQGVFLTRRYGRVLFLCLFCLAAVPTVLWIKPVSGVLLGDGRTAPGLLFLLVCIALTGFENIDKAIFLGTGQVLPTTISEVGELCLRIVGVLVLLPLFPKDPMWQAFGMVGAMVASECFSVSFLSACFHRRFGKKSEHDALHTPDGALGKEKSFAATQPGMIRRGMRNTALPICGSSVLNKLLFTANTVLLPQMLMLGGMDRKTALDDFAVLFSLAAPLTVLPTCVILPVAGLILPKMSENLARERPLDNLRKTAKLLQLVGVCALPFCFYIILLGEPVCQLLYGSVRPAAYLFLLAPAAAFEYYEIAVANLLNGLGKTTPAAASIVVEGLVLLAGTLFLTPRLGVLGFCMGKAASTLVAAVINLVALRRAIPLRWRLTNWLWRPLLASALAACISRLLDLGLDRALPEHGVFWPLFIATIVYLAVYFGALYLMGTRPIAYLRRTLHLDGVMPSHNLPDAKPPLPAQKDVGSPCLPGR